MPDLSSGWAVAVPSSLAAVGFVDPGSPPAPVRHRTPAEERILRRGAGGSQQRKILSQHKNGKQADSRRDVL